MPIFKEKPSDTAAIDQKTGQNMNICMFQVKIKIFSYMLITVIVSRFS